MDIQLYKNNLKTSILGQNFIYLDETQSTNDDLWDLVNKNNHQIGTVILAENQNQGRGRRGRKWFSQSGKSLTFSVLLHPFSSIEKIGTTTLLSGIAIVKAIQKTISVNAKLKWPNDIIIDSKKTGGVLSESRKIGNQYFVVIGIGLNVNEKLNDFPSELISQLTSLSHHTKKTINREILLSEILNQFEKHLMMSEKEVLVEWNQNCGHMGSTVRFHQGNNVVEGRFMGLNQKGHAVIDINNSREIFTSGDLILS
jgi:BirA family transcriptional regulator, biotin operon repressor / biotin---[acetyl-CoA-carboxylase] ligase